MNYDDRNCRRKTFIIITITEILLLQIMIFTRAPSWNSWVVRATSGNSAEAWVLLLSRDKQPIMTADIIHPVQPFEKVKGTIIISCSMWEYDWLLTEREKRKDGRLIVSDFRLRGSRGSHQLKRRGWDCSLTNQLLKNQPKVKVKKGANSFEFLNFWIFEILWNFFSSFILHALEWAFLSSYHYPTPSLTKPTTQFHLPYYYSQQVEPHLDLCTYFTCLCS